MQVIPNEFVTLDQNTLEPNLQGNNEAGVFMLRSLI